MARIKPYSLEFRQEAVRLLRTSGRSIPQLAAELGVSPQSLRNWREQLAVDAGTQAGLTTDEREECGGFGVRCGCSRRSGRS